MTTSGSFNVAENDFSKNFDALLQMQQQYMAMWQTAGAKTENQKAASNPFFDNICQFNLMIPLFTKTFEDIANAGKNTNGQTVEQRQSLVNQALDDLLAQLNKIGTAPFTPAPGITNLWGEPTSFWQQAMQTHNFSIPGTADDATPGQIPGLGPGREKIEELQKLQLLVQAYQAAQQEYTQSFSTYWAEVIAQLKIKIADLTVLENDILSPTRVLYNLWIDIAETIYAKTTRTDAQQKCFASLVNASMALKKAVDDIQQDALAALNMPTRNEIDTLSERLQHTRRENRLLRKELNQLKVAFERSQITNKTTKRKICSKKKSATKKASAKNTK